MESQKTIPSPAILQASKRRFTLTDSEILGASALTQSPANFGWATLGKIEWRKLILLENGKNYGWNLTEGTLANLSGNQID